MSQICRCKEIWREDQQECWHLAKAYPCEWNFIFSNILSVCPCKISKVTYCSPWLRICTVARGAEEKGSRRCPDCPLHHSEWLPVSPREGAWKFTQTCRRCLQKWRPKLFLEQQGQDNSNEKVVQPCEKLGMSYHWENLSKD